MDLVGELFDALTQLLADLGEPRVLLHELDDLGRLFRRQFLSLDARLRERLAVLGVGVGVRLVAIGLPGLGESRISGAAYAACRLKARLRRMNG